MTHEPVHASLGAAPAGPGRAWLTASHLNVAVGDYQVRFVKRAAWTLGAMSYRGHELLTETGAFQSVLNVQVEATGDQRPDPWIGTGHGKERIVSLSLVVDDQVHALGEEMVESEAWTGRRFTLVKVSDLGPFRHTARVTLDESGLHEDLHFDFQGPAMPVNFLYVFMHCFSKSLEQWRTGMPDGQEQHGVFLSDNSFSLAQDIRWAALFAPELGVGVAYAYPQAYAGLPPFRNSFWNRPRDNKLYLRVLPPQERGVSFGYQVRLQGFAAAAEGWDVTARSVAKKIGH